MTILEAFQEALTRRLGSRLKEIWLFGSRARNTAGPNSDWDVLVVAEGAMPELRWLLAEEVVELAGRYPEPLEPMVYTPELWAAQQHSPLGKNVRNEGQRLL